MMNQRIVWRVGLFILLLINTTTGLAASFSAKMVQTKSGETQSVPFYFDDGRYRYESKQDGRPLIILVDRNSKKTRILVPDEKLYLEIGNDDMESLMNNPYEAIRVMAGTNDVSVAGTERVQDVACDRQEISVNGKPVMTAWIAKSYGFPIKIRNEHNGDLVELVEIDPRNPDPTLFQVPAGFRLAEKMPVAPPAWADDVAGAPWMKPPFEKKLSEGQIILIKPKANFKVTVTGTNAGQGKCVFTVVPFKDERPLHKPSLGTFNVSTGGMTTSQKVSPQQADTIVVRAKEGGIVISAAYEEAPEGLVLNTYDIKANSNRVFDVNHHKASRLILRDKPGDGKASRAKVLVYETLEKKLDGGVTQFVHGRKLVDETISLGEGQSRFWHFEADRNAGDMDVEVLTGGLQARTEQPEKPGLVPPSWARTPAAPTAVQMASTSQASDTSSTSGQPSNTKLSDTKRMVLVLDASGSMWGQIQGKAKIEIAKGVLDKLIDGMPADLQVGLYAYGHRRKGDCADIEMLAPVGPLNKSMLKTKIAAISPKGKTPLSEAVRQAAKTLRYTEARATVVLVSDGLETCDVDPCRLAEDLAMSGVDFTVHVIGFDISEAEQEQLRCLADKTGGLFLAAADAGALQEALSRTVAKVEEPPAPIKEDPGTAQVSGPASVPAGSAFDAAWQGPDSRDDYIAIARKTDDDRRYLDYRYTKTGSPVKLIAPPDPGDYELRYVHNHSRKVLGRAGIKVTPIQASVQAPAEADVATEFEVNWQGPAYKSDYISIARLDQNPGSYINYTYTQAGSPLKVRAPSDAGTYEVRYILGRGSKLLAKTTIEIKPVTATVQGPGSAPVASEFEVTWSGPANKEDYICVARLDQNPGSYVNYTYTQKGSPLKVRAPSDAGTYEVRYILGRGSKLLAKAGITITPVTAEVDPPTAAKANTVFEVRWKGPGYKQDYISVARPDQKASQYKTYGYTNRGNPCKVKAPKEPGTYEVRYIQGYGKKLLAKKTIRIE